MQTTLELSESILRRTEQAARARGVSVDALVSDVLEREFVDEAQVGRGIRPHISFPIMSSSELETLDLSDFNFDDLLT